MDFSFPRSLGLGSHFRLGYPQGDVNDFEPFYDLSVPFLNIGENKMIYLEVFRRFINPYLGLFSFDITYFTHFPFKAKEIILSLKKKKKIQNSYNSSTFVPLQSRNSSSDQGLSKYEHIAIHYFEALHMQFYAICAIAAKALGHIRASTVFIKHARVMEMVLQDVIGNLLSEKLALQKRIVSNTVNVRHLCQRILPSLLLSREDAEAAGCFCRHPRGCKRCGCSERCICRMPTSEDKSSTDHVPPSALDKEEEDFSSSSSQGAIVSDRKKTDLNRQDHPTL